MEIRLLGKDNLEKYKILRLHALSNNPEAFGSSYEEEVNFSNEKMLSKIIGENIRAFGAFDGEKLIGVVSMLFQKREKMKHRADICGMYVEPYIRNMGIGRHLMIKTIKCAKKNPYIKQIYLTVVSNNTYAKKLYNSMGFEIYGVDKKAIKVGNEYYDEDLMVLYL